MAKYSVKSQKRALAFMMALLVTSQNAVVYAQPSVNSVQEVDSAEFESEIPEFNEYDELNDIENETPEGNDDKNSDSNDENEDDENMDETGNEDTDENDEDNELEEDDNDFEDKDGLLDEEEILLEEELEEELLQENTHFRNIIDGEYIDLNAFEGAKITIGESGTYNVSGSIHMDTEDDSIIVIETGVAAVLEIDCIYIDSDKSFIQLEENAELTLVLKGSSTVNTRRDSGYAPINVPESSKLTIRTEGGGTLDVTGSKDGAGIGGNRGENAGTIIIDSGTVTVNENIVSTNNDRWQAAGIGGGYKGAGGNIVLNGGNVTVTVAGYGRGAGIGSGADLDETDKETDIRINDGTVKVTSANIATGAGIGSGEGSHNVSVTINSGTVHGEGAMGAGIGGGAYADNVKIDISGGNVIGKHYYERQFVYYTGAGIGTGYNGGSASIRISGGNVDGWGGSASAGIGSGSIERISDNSSRKNPVKDEMQVKIEIFGGTVKGGGGLGAAGIGSGRINDWVIKNDVSIFIGNAFIDANGGSGSAGIGSGSFMNLTITNPSEAILTGNIKIDIENSTVTATASTGSGIGIGEIVNESRVSGTENLSDVQAEINIKSSEIDAKGGKDYSPGIGSNYMASQAKVFTSIKIHDSKVTAFGGKGNPSTGIVMGGPGIGIVGGSGTLSISGGSDITSTAVGQGTAAIGTGYYTGSMSIDISDSKVVANGYTYGTGIGTGYRGGDMKIRIAASEVEAYAGEQSAGIGTGLRTSSQYGLGEVEIIIEDSTVKAFGGVNGAGIGGGPRSGLIKIYIDGGKIEAVGGEWGSGIGAGVYGGNIDVQIKDGDITAAGGKYGTGIGTAYDSADSETADNGNVVHIFGGTIMAVGDISSAGIGGGSTSPTPKIIIDGGTVEAQGGQGGAGIGSGRYSIESAEITVIDGVVLAKGGQGGAGIGTGDTVNHDITVNLTGGSITAIGGELLVGSSKPSAYGIGAGSNNDETVINSMYIHKDAGVIAFAVSEGRAFQTGFNRGSAALVNAYIEEASYEILNQQQNISLEIENEIAGQVYYLQVPKNYQSFGYDVADTVPVLHRTKKNSDTVMLTPLNYGEEEHAEPTVMPFFPNRLGVTPLKISQLLPSEQRYYITYAGNGSTGGSVEYDSAVSYRTGDEIAVIDRNKVTLVKTGYIFSHWNTKADGSGIDYREGDLITFEESNIVLYAQWIKDGNIVEPTEPPVKPGEGGGSNNESDRVLKEFMQEAETVSSIPEIEFHKKYIYGYPDGTFRTDAHLTRAEAMMMLYNLAEEDSIQNLKKSNFSDLKENAWYMNAVLYGEERNIIVGYEGKFRPDDAITRAEMAVIISKIAEQQNLEYNQSQDNLEFTDVKSSHWAYRFVQDAAAKGWIVGYGDGRFNPDTYITRAEATVMINAIYNRKADKEFINSHKLFNDLCEEHWAFGEIMEASISHEFIRLEDNSEHWIKN